jgi:hypothetical protein
VKCKKKKRKKKKERKKRMKRTLAAKVGPLAAAAVT